MLAMLVARSCESWIEEEALDDRHASSGQQMCFEDPAPKNSAMAEHSHNSANILINRNPRDWEHEPGPTGEARGIRPANPGRHSPWSHPCRGKLIPGFWGRNGPRTRVDPADPSARQGAVR
jgi:hypothetical protein